MNPSWYEIITCISVTVTAILAFPVFIWIHITLSGLYFLHPSLFFPIFREGLPSVHLLYHVFLMYADYILFDSAVLEV